MVDVIAGAWRNGLDKALASQVQVVEERREKGFRQLPYESTVSELALMLDAYDALLNEILTESCCHVTRAELEIATASTEEELDKSIDLEEDAR